MVDQALLERILGLDESARLELRDAIEASVRGSLPSDDAELLDRLVAADDAADWSEYVTLDELERRTRSTRAARSA